jgi:hypothetical protein
MVFRESVEKLKVILGACQTDAPLANIQTQIGRVVCGFLADRYDRRVVGSYVQKLIVSDIFEDNYSLAPPAALDTDTWIIPSGVPTLTFMQIIQQLPLVPTTEILWMHPGLVDPLRRRNLSRWVTRPFVNYHRRIPGLDSKPIDVKIDSIFMLLPDKFPNPHSQQ